MDLISCYVLNNEDHLANPSCILLTFLKRCRLQEETLQYNYIFIFKLEGAVIPGRKCKL